MARHTHQTDRCSRLGIGAVVGFFLLAMYLAPFVPQTGVVQAQQHVTMTPGEWQVLASQVARQLDQLGMRMGVSPQVRAPYVRALTVEYLHVFQTSLRQGASKQQADRAATRHVVARIRQLQATPPGYTGNNWGVTGPGYNRRGPFGDSMSDGRCSFVNGIPVGDCG